MPFHEPIEHYNGRKCANKYKRIKSNHDWRLNTWHSLARNNEPHWFIHWNLERNKLVSKEHLKINLLELII